jgi:hypothetical protein
LLCFNAGTLAKPMPQPGPFGTVLTCHTERGVGNFPHLATCTLTPANSRALATIYENEGVASYGQSGGEPKYATEPGMAIWPLKQFQPTIAATASCHLHWSHHNNYNTSQSCGLNHSLNASSTSSKKYIRGEYTSSYPLTLHYLNNHGFQPSAGHYLYCEHLVRGSHSNSQHECSKCPTQSDHRKGHS